MSSTGIKHLIFHQTSTSVQVGLFQDKTLLAHSSVPYRDASKDLIPSLDTLLKTKSITLSEISYIGCTIGPAPFTTLRTVVVTVNGLGFATGIPLIGINGLLCLAQESHKASYQRTYAINNAFGNEVYCAIYDPAEQYLDCSVISRSTAIENIAAYQAQHPHANIQIVGNAIANSASNQNPLALSVRRSPLAKTDVSNGCGSENADTIETPAAHASLEAIAAAASTAWNAGQAVSELKPYYGKTAF